MATQSSVKFYVEAAGDEMRVVFGALKEKGLKRFGRVLCVSGFVAIGIYMVVYLPARKKNERLQFEIDRAKSMAEYGARYKQIRDQLNAAYAGLPNLTDRDQWLSNSVRDSLLAGGLETESFTPVSEQELDGLVSQVLSVSLTLRFSEFYRWLLRVENARPMMHVQSVDLMKKTDRLGLNSATFEVMTVIPKKRFQ